MLGREMRTGGLIGLIAFCTALAADEIKLEQLPKPVKATLAKRYPKAKLTRAVQDLEDDVPVFQVALTNEKKELEVSLSETGAVRWISSKLPAEKLPKPVTAVLQQEFPKSKVTAAAEIFNVRDGKDVLEYYDIELTTSSKEQRILNVEPDGSIIVDEVVEAVVPVAPASSPAKKK